MTKLSIEGIWKYSELQVRVEELQRENEKFRQDIVEVNAERVRYRAQALDQEAEIQKLRIEQGVLERALKRSKEVRYGYNFERGEWWPVEGPALEIGRRVSVPLAAISQEVGD